MANRVVLHVGAMKSGTTYLQRVLWRNRDLLAERGLLLPGRDWPAQVGGVADVLDRKRVATPPEPGAWQALVDEIATWDGDALISMEFLGQAGAARVQRVVASFPAGSVRVVITARDLNRNLPAMWQESLRNGKSQPLDEYVEAVRAARGPGRTFWREQDVAAMADRWSRCVGADQVTVVTVPDREAPRSLLWERFAGAVGLDAADVSLPDTVNPSLGATSAEVLRRLNAGLDDLSFPQYARVVKHGLATRVLERRRDREPGLGLDVPDWLPAAADRVITGVRDLGVVVVGDLEDLRPVPVPGVHPGEVSAEQQLEVALDLLTRLVRAQPAATDSRAAVGVLSRREALKARLRRRRSPG